MGEMYMWKEQVIQDDREESQNYVGKIWEWLTGLCDGCNALLIDCKSIRTLVLSVFTFRAIVSSIIKVWNTKENEERKWNSEIGKIVDPRYIIRETKNERDE